MYRGDCIYIDGYNCVGRDAKLLTPNRTVSGDRAYQKVIKEIGPTRRSRAGHRSHRISVLIKKYQRAISLSLSLFMQRQKKSHVMTQARSQPSELGRELSHQKPNLPSPRSWTFQPPGLCKNKFLLFKPSTLW